IGLEAFVPRPRNAATPGRSVRRQASSPLEEVPVLRSFTFQRSGRALALALALVLSLAGSRARSEAGGGAPTPAPWVARSDENAQVLLQVMAHFAPEQAAHFGVTGVDDQIFDL